MSISLERLRALRKQAGDKTVREAPEATRADVAPGEASKIVPIPDVLVTTAVAGSSASGPYTRQSNGTGMLKAHGPKLARPLKQAADEASPAQKTFDPARQVRPPAAANTKRVTERSVLDWMDPPSTPAANESQRRGLQPLNVEALRRLIATRERKPAAAVSNASRSRHRSAGDRALPGQEIAPGLHLIEAFLPQAIPPDAMSLAFAKRHDEVIDPRHLLFFDTETTGLAGGTGTRAFMIGAADWHVCAKRGQGLRVRQLMMSTMAAESAMLQAFNAWLSADTVLCSYNGRSYDAPLLKTRYRLARLAEPLSALDHVDLLHPTRRRYRGTWENCKLATIERQLLRIVRDDDLPGSEAPAAWLTFLRGGSAYNLRRVAQHNHQDVVTLAQLFQHLVKAEQQDQLAPLD